jgi:addiction module HigA family antidote
MTKRGIPYCHPGQLFRNELIIEQGLTVAKIAELLGVSRITVSNIINEKAAISPEMAVRIATVFGGTADIWMRFQAGYDLEKAGKKVKQFKLTPYRPERSA